MSINLKRQKNITAFFKKSNAEGTESKKFKTSESEEEMKEVNVKTGTKDTVSNFLASPSWSHINQNNLKISYAVIFGNRDSNAIFSTLESEIEYFTGDLAKVKVFGKTYPIPRQQSAYGDSGIRYKYSGTIVPALPWTNSEAQGRCGEAGGSEVQLCAGQQVQRRGGQDGRPQG